MKTYSQASKTSEVSKRVLSNPNTRNASEYSSKTSPTDFRSLGITICLLIFAMIGVACSSSNGDPRPPELMIGSDVCEECGMVVSDARYAAATLIEGGHTHKFDDLAEMFLFQATHPEDVVRAWFVHDYEAETWIRGETAFYVRSEAIHSPMGYGVAAFETREAAETFAANLTEAQIFSFAELNAWMKARAQ